MRELNITESIDAIAIKELKSGKKSAVVIATNGIIKNNGKAVMGAGIAKYFRDTYPGIDLILGEQLSMHKNHAFYLGLFENKTGEKCLVCTMPTKNDWKNDSDIELIKQSCHELMIIADKFTLTNIYLPRPGCMNGRLDWNKDVKPAIKNLLDDRFVVTYGYKE